MMRHVRKFWRLSSAEKALLTQAFFWVGAIRLGLMMVSFQRILRLTERMVSSRRSEDPDHVEPKERGAVVRRIVWAVMVAGRRIVPNRPCLTQALAARVMLQRRGITTTLRIGVKKEEDVLAAHAWLEQDGRIIIGGERSPALYVPFEKPIQS